MTTSTGTSESGRISCLIQAAGMAVGHEQELATRLQQHHLAHYPSDKPTVLWRVAEPGRMFTAGEPSRTSTVSCTIGGATTRSDREAYMRGVCNLWTEVTGCSDHDVLVSISEVEPAATTPETGQE